MLSAGPSTSATLLTCFPIVYPKAEVELPAISNCKFVQKKSEHKDSREDLMVDVDIVDRQQDDVSKPKHSVCGIIMKCIGVYYPRSKELFPDHERIRDAERELSDMKSTIML